MFLNVGNIFPVNMALKMEKILRNWENLVAELRAEDGSKSPIMSRLHQTSGSRLVRAGMRGSREI